MRFVTAKIDNRGFIGLVDERLTYVIDLQSVAIELGVTSIPNTMIECIELGEEFLVTAKKIYDYSLEHSKYKYDAKEVKLLAPIPRPLKNIFCVGKNYADHAIELGSEADIPKHIMMFTKAPTTVIGTNEVVLNHSHITNELDYEGELAIIIGKRGRGIKREEAMDYCFGFTIVNDITARDLQSRHKQFFLGKSLDTTCPMGPLIAHKSVIKNPENLQVVTKVNGEVRQNGNTEQFIFPIETIISVISQGMTLEPGDIIATGTPAGVGKGFKPPRYLKGGDVIEISIEGLGTLQNTIEE